MPSAQVTIPLRQLRLNHSTEIRAVFRDGRRLNDPHLRVVFRATERPHPRFCIQVGRRVSKKAVVRNRIRRRTREAFRAPFSAIGRGFDVVIMAQIGVATLPWEELRERSLRMVERIAAQ